MSNPLAKSRTLFKEIVFSLEWKNMKNAWQSTEWNIVFSSGIQIFSPLVIDKNADI